MNKSIKIFLDSQAVLEAFGSYLATSKLVQKYKIAKNDSIERPNRLSMVWIPDHSGLESNEAADSLAREGASSSFIGPEPIIGIALGFTKQTLNTWMARSFMDFWQNLPGLAHSKAFIHPPKLGLLTGHCHLNHHMQRLGLSEASVWKMMK